MEILDKNPNPTKDQHFMVDQEMLQLIYDNAEIKENENIKNNHHNNDFAVNINKCTSERAKFCRKLGKQN